MPAEDHHAGQSRGTAAGNRPASLKRCSGRANLRAGEPGHANGLALGAAGANNVSGKAGVALLRVVMHAFAWPPPGEGGGGAAASRAGKVVSAEGEAASAPKREDGHASRDSRHAASEVCGAALRQARSPDGAPAQRPPGPEAAAEALVADAAILEGVKGILMHRRPHSATRTLDGDRFEAAYEAARHGQNGHRSSAWQEEGNSQSEEPQRRDSGQAKGSDAAPSAAADAEADDDDFNSDWDSDDDSFSLISGRPLGKPLVRPAVPRLVLPPPGCLTVGGTEIDPATVGAANRELRESAANQAAAPAPRGAR